MNDSLLLLVPALFVGGIFSAVSGGGLGIIMILLLNLTFPVDVSVALASILAFGIQISKTLHFRRFIRTDILWWYALPGVPVAYAAGFLLFSLPTRAVEIGIGTFCLCVAIRTIFPGASGGTVRLQPRRITLVLGGIFNGLMAGLIGNGNLLRSPLLLAFGLRKEIFIGTAAAIALILNVGRTGAYAQEIAWTPEIILLVLVTMPVLYLSVTIGKRLLIHVSERVFELLQAGIMVVGAIRFLFFPS